MDIDRAGKAWVVVVHYLHTERCSIPTIRPKRFLKDSTMRAQLYATVCNIYPVKSIIFMPPGRQHSIHAQFQVWFSADMDNIFYGDIFHRFCLVCHSDSGEQPFTVEPISANVEQQMLRKLEWSGKIVFACKSLCALSWNISDTDTGNHAGHAPRYRTTCWGSVGLWSLTTRC